MPKAKEAKISLQRTMKPTLNANLDLGFSVIKWTTLMRSMKWKAYTPLVSASITDIKKKVRVQSSEYYLSKIFRKV